MISKLIPIDYNKLEQCIKADDHMFKESSEHSCLPSWCNGIAGQILARVIGYTATLNKSTKEVFESSLNSYLERKISKCFTVLQTIMSLPWCLRSSFCFELS